VREYILTLLTAAAVTYLLTPLVRRIAMATGAMHAPRDRDVHVVRTPLLGGVAMYAGLAAALLVANQLPYLRAAIGGSRVSAGLLLAGGLVVLIGIVDDRWGMSALSKLAGQVAAAGILVWSGTELSWIPWPRGQALWLTPNQALVLTILVVVLTINAVNFIDGLDGLAAGVTAIGAGAFFIYAYHLAILHDVDVAAAPALLSAALAGACVGFLPHNFAPARVFMGDSGSMLVGLLLSAAAVTATTTVDPGTFQSRSASLPLILPLLIPLAVLAVPFFDLSLAIIRRLARGQSPFAPDKQHLHHRMLALGHTHRRAVLLLYFWSALIAGGGVTFAITHRPWTVAVTLVGLALAGMLLSVVPRFTAYRRVGVHR
jgi:UDP-GlcNAc:undecaprenyl-phosphate GlcNAc-1-phosphate transferase